MLGTGDLQPRGDMRRTYKRGRVQVADGNVVELEPGIYWYLVEDGLWNRVNDRCGTLLMSYEEDALSEVELLGAMAAIRDRLKEPFSARRFTITGSAVPEEDRIVTGPEAVEVLRELLLVLERAAVNHEQVVIRL